jgi:hypothetical protein
MELAADTITLTIALDVAGRGYLVELISPAIWPRSGHVYSETLIPFNEIEDAAPDERLAALLAMHLKFLGFT